jgi:hypothetical protein
MKFSQSTGIACLLATCASAMPLSFSLKPRDESKKAGILWDWTNTNALENSAGGSLASTAQSLESSKISWVMNWETWRPWEVPQSIEFQPMVRGVSHLSGDGWSKLQERVAEGCTTVHFFNEPERNSISATDAVNYWRSQMLPLRSSSGVKLVGPAVASSPEGTAWFNEFYGALSKEEYPDFLGLHFYTAEATAAEQEVSNAQAYIEERHNSFQLQDVPVVVSEIGSTSRDSASVTTFTEGAIKYMDAQPWISQYGFFGASRTPTDGFVSPAAQLLTTDGGLTTLGKIYTGL